HLRGGWVYNFWRDSEHVRGIWRRTRPDEYSKKEPRWDVLLDLDRLNVDEKQDWVWNGETCLPPSYERCLLQLSHSGTDAVVIREFDVARDTFVPDGFYLPEAKADAYWLDANSVLINTDFGPDSLTRSGYPRIVKLWTRGQPLSEARIVLEGESTDMLDTSLVDFRPEGTYAMLVQFLSSFAAKYYLMMPD